MVESVQIDRPDPAKAPAYSGGQGKGDNTTANSALLRLHDADGSHPGTAPGLARSYDYWSRLQKDDGSWGYDFTENQAALGSPSTGSMTFAEIVP